MDKEKKYSSILAFGDTHAPFNHPDFFHFVSHVADVFNPEIVIHTGDEVDLNCIKFHPERYSDAQFSSNQEFENAIYELQPYYKRFPNLKLVESNHGSLVYQRQRVSGIPIQALKSYSEMLEVPTWEWFENIRIKLDNEQGCLFQHQITANTLMASKEKGCNTIQGHFHSKFELLFRSNGREDFWGATIGCGIDRENQVYNYSKASPKKAVLGCLVIINSVPILIPMRLDKHQRWIGKVRSRPTLGITPAHIATILQTHKDLEY